MVLSTTSMRYTITLTYCDCEDPDYNQTNKVDYKAWESMKNEVFLILSARQEETHSFHPRSFLIACWLSSKDRYIICTAHLHIIYILVNIPCLYPKYQVHPKNLAAQESGLHTCPASNSLPMSVPCVPSDCASRWAGSKHCPRKFYKVDSNDKVTRLRRECPQDQCGPGAPNCVTVGATVDGRNPTPVGMYTPL